MSFKQKAAAAFLVATLFFSGGFYAGRQTVSVSTGSSQTQSILSPGKIETVFTPYQDGLGAYLKFLDRAKKSIQIACYGFTEPQIVDKLIELKQSRGVKIQLVLDRSQSRGQYQKEQILRLRQAGIEVIIGSSEKSGQIMHNKFTIIDAEWVEDGSWNYTRSADKQANTQNYVQSAERAHLFGEYWMRLYRFMSSQDQNLH